MFLEMNGQRWQIFKGDSKDLLQRVEPGSVRLVFTSPPYNVGKEYEKRTDLHTYSSSMLSIIRLIPPLLKSDGYVCWQVGNHVSSGVITPLDMIFDELFAEVGLYLRRRLVWRVPHGLHSNRSFSGRYETVSVYSFPGKTLHEKFPLRHEWDSCLMDIPNVKSAHIERSLHPCQFPVEMVDRFVIGLTDEGDTVLDPFAGVGTTVISAVKNSRIGLGFEMVEKYVEHARCRLKKLEDGSLKMRCMYTEKTVSNTSDKRSIRPREWDQVVNPSLHAEDIYHSTWLLSTVQGPTRYFQSVDRETVDVIILSGSSIQDTDLIYNVLRPGGSICTLVNHSKEGFALRSDLVRDTRLSLKNRVVCWHASEPIYSSILWFTKSGKNPYYFDLDAVRVPSKYPGKCSAKTGKLSGNPLGKNPSNIWVCEDVSCGSMDGLCVCHFRRIIRALSPPGGAVIIHTSQPPRDSVLAGIASLKRNVTCIE